MNQLSCWQKYCSLQKHMFVLQLSVTSILSVTSFHVTPHNSKTGRLSLPLYFQALILALDTKDPCNISPFDKFVLSVKPLKMYYFSRHKAWNRVLEKIIGLFTRTFNKLFVLSWTRRFISMFSLGYRIHTESPSYPNRDMRLV
jgi:hypothetical protein